MVTRCPSGCRVKVRLPEHASTSVKWLRVVHVRSMGLTLVRKVPGLLSVPVWSPPPPFEVAGEFALWHFNEDPMLSQFEPGVAANGPYGRPVRLGFHTLLRGLACEACLMIFGSTTSCSRGAGKAGRSRTRWLLA